MTTDFPQAELTAELTLADGLAVHVTTGVHGAGPASRGRITVRVPCGAVPSGHSIARLVIRNEATGEEAPVVYIPPQSVPLCGYLDVSVGAGEIRQGSR